MPIESLLMTNRSDTLNLKLDKPLGVEGCYAEPAIADSPEPIRSLLGIDGVIQVAVSDNIVTLDRDPAMDWDTILDDAKKVLV